MNLLSRSSKSTSTSLHFWFTTKQHNSPNSSAITTHYLAAVLPALTLPIKQGEPPSYFDPMAMKNDMPRDAANITPVSINGGATINTGGHGANANVIRRH